MARQSRGSPPTTDDKVKQAMVGLASKRWNSVYAAAKGVGMSAKTLTRRLNGGKSRVEAREEQQKLTKAEEKVLVKWITHLTATGHPARHAFIRDMASKNFVTTSIVTSLIRAASMERDITVFN